MQTRPPSRRSVRDTWHSILLGVFGFGWLFSATLFIAVGTVLGVLGVGGHLLVRVRPGTTRVINYDPSSVALFAPIPFGVGCVMALWFVMKVRSRQG